MPKVSVVIPTYNCARYILATVESVLAQTYTDFELIVVDDGSTDETRQLLQAYRDRITYIFQENKKYSGARNTGIRAASGKYIAFLDSDDLWLPNKLEQQVAVMEQYADISLVHCQAAYVDPEGHPIRFRGNWVKGADEPGTVISDPTRELFFGAIVTTSTVMVRRSILEEVGPFDDTHIHGEDWELWVRLASRGPFAYIPKPMIKYRVYGWHKVLSVESSEAWTNDQFRTIERATSLWRGDVNELECLRSLGAATIYTRAALANYHLGQGPQGQAYLEKALIADPGLGNKERFINLAIDRAKLIETETGSYQQAETFIETFFANLPSNAPVQQNAQREAIGWLYIGGAFENYRGGNTAATRRLLMQGVAHAPMCLRNRGVVSVALKAYFRGVLANGFRWIKV